MGKYTKKLDEITQNHYTGSAESREPSGLLVATAARAHAELLATGNSETRPPSPKLNILVSNNNNNSLNLTALRDNGNLL